MDGGKGRLVLVVGPSGAGKDTLLALAADQLAGDPRFVFPKRQVTREADLQSEDHDFLSRLEFDRIHADGNCALSWEAHGFGYVIPQSVLEQVAAGRVAVCNGSRRILPEAKRKYPDCKVIVIDADRETRAQRLADRSRESRAEITARLDREARIDGPGLEPVYIDNSGDLKFSTAAMCDALLTIAESLRNPDSV